MFLAPRDVFVRAALSFRDEVVVWGGLDCSDLVARAEFVAGLPPRMLTFTAQSYFDKNPTPVAKPRPGDLGFFGADGQHVVHVVIATPFGILSADGATSKIKDLVLAANNKASRVRLHPDTAWYKSAPFLGWRDHAELG